MMSFLFVRSNLEEFVTNYKVNLPHSERGYQEIFVHWQPPLRGWFCLNMDGAVKGNGGIESCGGLIRNNNGQWKGGFAKYIGRSSVFVAKLQGILLGLKLALHLQLQIDSKAVVTAIKGSRWDVFQEEGQFELFTSLLSSFNHIRIHHSCREENYCADKLVDYACSLEGEYVTFQQ